MFNKCNVRVVSDELVNSKIIELSMIGADVLEEFKRGCSV